MDEYLYVASLAIVAILALCALYARGYRDNLLQNLGLALVVFGAAMRLWSFLHGSDLDRTRYIFVYGLALYAVGTARKYRSFNR